MRSIYTLCMGLPIHMLPSICYVLPPAHDDDDGGTAQATSTPASTTSHD